MRRILNRRHVLAPFTGLLLAASLPLSGQPAMSRGNVRTNGPLLIDLPTALQLAGARNLDIQIAREKLAEAQANREISVWQFFPSVTPGIGYRRHDGLTQDVQGRIIDVNKESYAVGPVIGAQVDLGDAIYRNLAARQLVKAAGFGLEGQRQDSLLAAALGYFDLAKARSGVEVARDAARIAQDYAGQVQQAVDIGIAFKGDALRAQVETEKNLLALRQAQEQLQVASARLVQTLHLESSVELSVADAELLPLTLFPTNAPLESLVAQAFAARPELAQSRSLLEAARAAKNGAKYGPLIPSVGAAVFVGGLGGGNETTSHSLGGSEDYAFALGWRIGPGGLFDRGRIRAAEARLKIADLGSQKLTDDVTRQVTENFSRWQSMNDQMVTANRARRTAEETLRLTQQRKEFAVGAVLENVQAEQDLTRTRLDCLNAIAEFNKAQYALKKAVGDLPTEGSDGGISSTASPRR